MRYTAAIQTSNAIAAIAVATVMSPYSHRLSSVARPTSMTANGQLIRATR